MLDIVGRAIRLNQEATEIRAIACSLETQGATTPNIFNERLEAVSKEVMTVGLLAGNLRTIGLNQLSLPHPIICGTCCCQGGLVERLKDKAELDILRAASEIGELRDWILLKQVDWEAKTGASIK